MTRRCSLCSIPGHSKRTCPMRPPCTAAAGGSGVVKLFGVRLKTADGRHGIKKSASMGNLTHCSASTAGSPDGGYHSDGPPRRRITHLKKGTPWKVEEHRQFLAGLHNLGKGDWKGISKNYVPSKTPSQIASHAQKYFIHQSNETNRKRRSSLFDMVPRRETYSSSMPIFMFSSCQGMGIINPMPRLDLSLKPVFMPSPFQLWLPTLHSFKNYGEGSSLRQILRPNPDVPKELVGLSRLTLEENVTVQTDPTLLSLRLPGQP